MGAFRLTGGCQCGAVRYTLSAPARATNHCHCSMCRKTHGAIFVTFSELPKAAFRIDKGAENLRDYQSTPGTHRRFCKTCGCHLHIDVDSMPDIVFVAAGTLDKGAHPGHPKEAEAHIFVGSKIPWYEITDGLPQKAES